MRRTPRHLFICSPRVVLGLVLGSFACAPEAPPAPDADQAAPAQAAAASGSSVLDEAAMAGKFMLTAVAERGTFVDVSKSADVPEGSRGLVRVSLLSGPKPPAGQVWVVNLDKPGEDGTWPLTTVSRELFEELALGQGHSSEVKLPDGLEAPEITPAADKVIVYKTDWCGVCKKLTAYLDRKGVAYEAKDIEKDRTAAAELQAKAKAQGVKTGSVPVIDVDGQLMVGFDRARLEKLL